MCLRGVSTFSRSEFRKLALDTEICSYSSKFFRVKLFTSVSNRLCSSIKVGFVVSKKFDKKAVVRNKFKRILRVITANTAEVFDRNFSYLFIMCKKALIEGATFELLTSDYKWIVRNVIKKANKSISNKQIIDSI